MLCVANLGFLFKEAGPLLSRYAAASKAGFKYVECDFPGEATPEELKNAVNENGVQQVLINCFQGNGGEMGFGATPGQEGAFKEALHKTLAFTRAVNCKKIHILSGRDLGPDKLSLQLETLEKNLRWAADLLSKEGIVGVIEPINPYSKPGYFLNSYEKAVPLIERIGSPHIRLQLDLFHLQLITGNICNNIKRFLPLTGHVQVAQAPHRHEPSSTGELNMKFILSTLEKEGYQGFIGLEYIPSGTTSESLSWIQEYGLKFC